LRLLIGVVLGCCTFNILRLVTRSEELSDFDVFLIRNNHVIITVGIRTAHLTFSKTITISDILQLHVVFVFNNLCIVFEIIFRESFGLSDIWIGVLFLKYSIACHARAHTHPQSHHVTVKEFGHLFTYFNITWPVVSSQSFPDSLLLWVCNFLTS
jgi:hypothetical protein